MSDNVVSIFKKKEEKRERDIKVTEGFSFEEIIKRNIENAERQSKERNKSNNYTTKSYRLKQ
jgi:hypothetical protein